MFTSLLLQASGAAGSATGGMADFVTDLSNTIGIDLFDEDIDNVVFQTNEFLCNSDFIGSQGPFWWLLVDSAFLRILSLATFCKPTTCKILFRETNPGRDKNGTKPQENKIRNASSPTSLVVDFSFLCKGTILSRELQAKSCKYAAYQTFILYGYFHNSSLKFEYIATRP